LEALFIGPRWREGKGLHRCGMAGHQLPVLASLLIGSGEGETDEKLRGKTSGPGVALMVPLKEGEKCKRRGKRPSVPAQCTSACGASAGTTHGHVRAWALARSGRRFDMRGARMQISARELTDSATSEYVREGAGQMRRSTTRSESVVCARRGKLA
jgi:hypothetical protein